MKEHIFYTFDPYEDYPWENAVKEAYQDGVRIYSFLYPMVLAWQEDGSFDFTLLDTITDRIMDLAPEGKMMPRAFLTTPFWWDDKYPEEMLKFSSPMPRQTDFPHARSGNPKWIYENKLFHGSNNASVASLQWKKDAGNAIYATTKHLVERYGREHIYAMQMAYGTCGEWGAFGSYLFGQSANGDFSEPMVRAYRNFLKEKYGDKPEFAAILPPSKAERQKSEFGILRSPKSIQYLLDYYETAAKAKNEALAHFCARAKDACPDMLCGSFGGSAMSIGSSASTLNYGGCDSKYLLKIKELDFISTPNNYFAQRKGATFSHTPVKSATRHKRFIGECDTRSALANNAWAPEKGFSDAQFIRETTFNLVTSGYLWHYDFGLNWYTLPELRYIRRKYLALDPAIFEPEHQAQIAVVADPESVNCTAGQAGFYRQFGETLTRELSRCGAFADHITMNDIFDLPPYKLYIFRDAFLYRPELREFLEKNNASALWFGPAGCIASDKVDISLAEKQTTFKLKAAENVLATNTVTLYGNDHFLNRGMVLPATPSGVEDINALWSPTLYAEPDEDCQVAGLVESLDLPGMVSRKSGERFDVWSSSPLLFAGTLRNLALAAKVDLRILSGDAEIYGDGNTFAIRIMSDEPVVIRAGKTLTNLISGEKFEPADGKVTFKGEKMKSYLFHIG